MIYRRNGRRRLGATLIEVLFAIFLVGAGALIVAATMPIANVSRAMADNNNKATSLAQKQLEAIRGLGYANATAPQLLANGLIDSTSPTSPPPEVSLPASTTYSFSNTDLAALDQTSRVLNQGAGYVSIEQVDIDLKRVTVVVRWVERDRPKTVVLATLVANL